MTYPKQFLPLLGDRSTFGQTIARVSDPELFDPPIVITGDQHRFLVLHELNALGRRRRS